MKGLQVALSVLVIAGAVIFLMVDSLSSTDALTYFHGADEVLARSEDFIGKRIRVGGHVEPGSIAQKPGTLQWSFRVQPVEGMLKHPEVKDQTLAVRYEGVVPDTFEDDAEVIVTGVLDPSGVFRGQELIAKCPSKYEVAETASR